MSTPVRPKKVAFLTAGGLAPCLSSAVGGLIERYTEIAPEIELIAYHSGYKGLLLGDSYKIGPAERAAAAILHRHGGSPIGNSRVKLTNVKDCVKRGLVKEGQDPQKVAADQLIKDGVDILHTIGGDDTNTAAADLAAYLAKHNYGLTVIGLPKTIDNDVFPIRQSLGAWTAAEQGARYFRNVVSEHNANPRMLIIHEVMGRNCGWLTAATAQDYRKLLDREQFVPGLGLARANLDVHAVYIPEMAVDLAAEAARLKGIMDRIDNVNIFISEGAGVESIVAEMQAKGQDVPRDAFGHLKLDAINPGKWFGGQFAKMLGAEKVLVQKSGYFARAAAANAEDLRLIKICTDLAVECALRRESGVIGHDEDRGNVLRAIEFPRIKGGKPFDIATPWFGAMLKAIGQPQGAAVAVKH
jgi:pyrophosphate--fructose-6-phosphate 1-phosphotransferase